MSSNTVDDRVVSMRFDNSKFLNGVQSTITALEKLKASLTFGNAKNGLDDIQTSANRFSLSNVDNATKNISNSFLAMTTIAITALSNIVNRAVDTGIQLTKALTIDPIKSGLSEYETNLNSIQTILANTQARGSTLEDVNKALDELNTYSDQTIYNFSEMARNIGTFTAAGVGLDESTSAIKGIANLAALSGSNSMQASTAMYQLSQAIAAGKVSLMDWNSVVNAGMGGATFQRALANTAVAMGKIDAATVDTTSDLGKVTIAGESFRESIGGGNSWLTSDVLTATLAQFTGDMTDAELAAQGFTAAQIESIKQTATTAKAAATEVKTLTGVFNTAKEVAGSGWAKTWQIIFGDFEEAKTLFTSMSNSFNAIINQTADARNALLKGWDELGGRKVIIEGFAAAFEGLKTILKPIGEAFRDVFPPKTAEDLLHMSENFRDFMKTIAISPETAKQLRSIFGGFFAILSIGGKILSDVADFFLDLFGVIFDNSDGFVNLAAAVGDWFVNLNKSMDSSNAVTIFFQTLGDLISAPTSALSILADSFSTFFDNIDVGKGQTLSDFLDRFVARFQTLDDLGGRIGEGWNKFLAANQRVVDFFAPAISAIVDALTTFGTTLATAISNADFNQVMDVINTGLFAGITLLIQKFLSNGINIDLGGDFLGGLNEAFGALTDTLQAMQTQIKSKAIMNIALAMAVLTISMVALSLIDSDNLIKALAGMTAAFGMLMASMALLIKMSGAAGFVKIPMLAASLVILSVAILILAAAVMLLSTLEWDELIRGLTGVGGLLLMLVGVAAGISSVSGPILRLGIAMIPFAIGLLILVSAVKSMADLSWAEIGKGLIGIAGALLLIAGAMWIMPPQMVLQAASLILVGIALKIIGSAIEQMGKLKGGEIGKGLAAIAGALLLIAGAMWIMPPQMILQAAALLVVASALAIIGDVMKNLGDMSWESIIKSLTMLAGAMLLIAAGLYLMEGTLPGAAALIVAAAALGMLGPVLILLGAMSWTAILKGLAALAGVFVVLGLAALVLTPVIPSLLLLGAALVLVGAGLVLAGAAASLFASAFSVFTTAAASGVATLSTFITMVPTLAQKVAEAIISFVETLLNGATTLATAAAKLVVALLDALIAIAPKLGEALTTLLQTLIKIVADNAPAMAESATELIITLLTALGSHIGEMVEVATTLLTNFIDALANNLPRVIQAGYDFIIKFINGLTDAINNNSERLGVAGGKLAAAIINGMVNGLRAGVKTLQDEAGAVAKKALDSAKAVLGIASPSKEFHAIGAYSSQGLANGISDYSSVVSSASENVALSALDTMAAALSDTDSLIEDNMNLAPVITPVIDMSNVSPTNDLFGGPRPPTSPAMSYNFQNKYLNDRIDELTTNIQKTQSATPEATQPTKVEFNQYNNSPKALSAAEIYRNTRSQIALAKEAVGI